MKISIIIPVLNEAKSIFPTLEDLFTNHSPEDVVVVDGGSTDQTVMLASEWTQVFSSSKGRARQMNAGAKIASGDVLLFLHADMKLPSQGLNKIKQAIRQGAQAGRFRMQFDDAHWLLRLYSSYTKFQFFSYGDQGFFVTRELFDQLKGYREDVPFEDVDFYRRLRQITTPVIVEQPVVATIRRFRGRSFIRQKLWNLLLVTLHLAGFNVLPIKKKLS